jgi:hypothetical protein
MMQKIVAFVLSESQKLKKGPPIEVKVSESAPHYYGISVPRQAIISKEESKIDGRKVVFQIKSYEPDVIIAETEVEVEDIFSEEAFELRAALINECHRVIKKRGGQYEMSEEYAVAIVSDYKDDPEKFLNRGAEIAKFLKSETLPLDEDEVRHTLDFQLKYAKDDLVIVDWDGAFIFDPYGEYHSILELLEIANLQLLRYRMLDHDLDDRLKKINKVLQNQGYKLDIFRNKELSQSFKDVISVRAKSVAEFEAIDRDIKLIGEWYSARLYELVSEKMRLDKWKEAIKEKLDSLEDVYSIVAENFSMSRVTYLEFIQIILFFILQLGWFGLIILEFIYYTK